ncbi:MAG TPA: ATP-binding protein [Xanthobacteraceae bacterium]|jgi:signal transduction histidine kinase|nr:ATP-binding protein [Xanthobacteraceae bacterium]
MPKVSALAGLVARVPARVQVKLLAAFLAIEVLLIVMGAVGLEVLSGVNQRADELIRLQRKIEAYRQVQHDITSQLYGVASVLLTPDELTLSSTQRQLNQFQYNVDRLQFVAKDEVELLDRFQQYYSRFTKVASNVLELIRAGQAAEARGLQVAQALPLADRLERLTNQLVNKAESDMVAGIEASKNAYVTSQWIVVGFALGSSVLALLLGYAISGSLIGPLTEVEARLGQIAAGDFSQRVNVANRDELGALAANINRTSEQLGRLYHQLELANLAKSRFLAAASHDLRQPLHALNLFLDQRRGEADQAERSRLDGQIDAAVAAMNELFNSLLDISKLDAGVLAPSVSEFPIDQLLKRIETTFAATARKSGLRLRVVSSHAWVRSDFILLERILLNLVSNAVRYTERGGVVVGCRRRNGRLRIDVCDSGIGIPEDQREKIFGEFYQLDGGESRGGLGLGLAIVERLCGLLDHSIQLVSSVGRGSRFSVLVSSAPARTAQASLEAPRRLADSEQGKLVMVIDDNEMVREGTRGLLKSWGCLVVTAESEDAAMTRFAEEGRRPDLIISDYHLARGKGGFELIDRLRGAWGEQIPAFLISGDTAPERLREASASGYYLLHKPVLPITLRSVVSQLLKSQASEGRGPAFAGAPAIRAPAATASPASPPQ